MARASEIADRRLVDRLGDHLFAFGNLGGVHERDRVARHRRAVCPPRVQVPVEARLDDVGPLAGSFEVSQRRRCQKAALGMTDFEFLKRRPAKRRIR